MMLIIALSASISFSSCSSDDDDASGGGGSTSGGGASAATIVGSYVGITKGSSPLSATFAENGTCAIRESGSQWSGTYSMAGNSGTVYSDNSEKGPYTISFVDGFMFLSDSRGNIRYVFYKAGQNLGTPTEKKLLGTWENKYSNTDGTMTGTVAYTFNNDGKGNAVGTTSWPKNSDRKDKVESFSFTYKMENAYVAKCTNLDDEGSHYEDDKFAAIIINNKIYILQDYISSYSILSKK